MLWISVHGYHCFSLGMTSTLVTRHSLFLLTEWVFCLPAVKRVAVFMTDGYSTRGVEFTRDNAATLTRTKGVKLFSVGISDRIDKAELDALASKPYNTHQLVIQTPGNPFNRYQVQRFAKQICRCE